MNNKTKGTMLMIIAALFFALMGAAVKSLPNIGIIEKMFFRNIIGVIIASTIIIKTKQSFRGNNKKALILRSFFGLLGVAGNYYALTRLPLADAEIINKTSSFFAIILSVIFLKEGIRKKQIFTIVLAFIGALLVIRPGFGFSIIPSLSAVAGAFFAGAAYTTVRHLSHTDSPDIIVFYFTFITIIITLPIIISSGNLTLFNSSNIIGLISIGVFASIAQYSMAYAYRYASASELSIYLYTAIVFSVIIGYFIWNEIPDLLSLLGGLLIIVGGFINYLISRKHKKIEIKID